jgi:peptidoglycan/LPS O-acetylase OafA/YrhL
MGTIRTILAITVVFTHSYGYIFVGGRNAVQLFYIISGFLISYIIVEKKLYVDIKKFYISRFLRLYPVYFFIAILTLLTFSVTSFVLNQELEFFNIYYGPPLSQILLIFSNILLFLQDWVMFFAIENNELVFSTNFLKSDIPLYKGLLVPQAWTLGVELSFYLVAPFILTKRKVLYYLLFFSLSLRVYLIYIEIGKYDPWTYRFFPTELAMFLLGAVSHQVILPFYRNIFSRNTIEKYSILSTYFLILLTLSFWLIPINEIIKTVILFTFFLLLMPFTFLFQVKRDWDKYIGDLSYPIYLSHIYVIYLTNLFMEKYYNTNVIILSFISIIVTICLSIGINIYIQNPIENLRNNLRKSK